MKHKNIFALMLVVLLLTSTGCLSMIYYPSRVLDKGGFYIGLGTHSERRWDDFTELAVYSSLYSRFGFGKGFDGGLELKLFQFFPCMAVLSARKQFDFDAVVIDGVTLGAGVGLLHPSAPPIEWNGSICLLKKAFSVTIGASRNEGGNYLSNYGFVINSTFAKVSYEFNIGKHFIVMPFVSYRHANTYKVGNNGEILEYWQRNQMGAGLSIAFKSK
ncbi:MAG: hypothetical protein PHW02_05965 [bacterium]|nr:hypothetical protein [bacterium]